MIEKKQNIIILFRGSSVDRSFIHKNELISSISCELKKSNSNYHIIDFPGPVTPKNSKHLNSNVKNLDIFIASECRVPFMTSIIPKIYKNTKINIKHLPTNHNGIVNLKCSREEKGWRSVEAKTAKHVSKYLKIYILNKIIDLNIKIPDSNLIKDKFKKISFPKVTDKEKKILQKEGISKTFKFYRKKKLLIDYRFSKNKKELK